MMNFRFYLLPFIGTAFLALASCDKPEVVEPDDKNPDVEISDTTEKVDTTKPEGPIVPEGSFMIQTSFSVDNTPEGGWKTTWLADDAVSVRSMMGTKPDEESVWTDQGKYVFNPTTTDTLVGDVEGRFFSNETYRWHAVYPYSEQQSLIVGHLPGEHVVQNGYGSTAHLSGTNMPLYGAAYTEGKTTPQFVMHQMAGVINIKVKNAMSSSVTIDQVKVEYPDDYLVGRFDVDFSNATSIGHGCLNLLREPIDASKEVVLKVEGAEELATGESADFYLPIMPNQLLKDSQLLLTLGDYVQIIDITSNMSIASGKMRTFNVTLEDPLDMELTSPAKDATVDMSSCERIEFNWTKVDDNEEYTILFSGSENMAKAHEIDVTGTSLSLSAQYFDNLVFPLGIEAGQTGKIYWTVVLRGSKNSAVASSLNVKRRPKDNEGRIADPLTIKVAILIEDLEIPGTGGKRMHEVCALNAPGGYRIEGGGWYDPAKLIKEYEEGLEKSSHGVVNYEVVETIYAERFFTSFNDQINYGGQREYITLDTLLYMFETRQVDNNTKYDYVGMMEYYGFDKMVEAGELNEVWVYSFPGGGMYESQMLGRDAFWCNSPAINAAGGAPYENLCIVMGLNYERTADLALHSFGHRFESIMSQVYEKKGGLYGWNYDAKSNVESLTNWEKYSAHNLEYEKFKPGYSHIGCCHFPPNSTFDYDYGNTRYVMTYADTWYDYPDIREDDSVARSVNRKEWSHAGGDQYGFMLWYYDHIPHYQGLCPRDNHLNNWWYYLVDYQNAMKYEEKLKAESIIN